MIRRWDMPWLLLLLLLATTSEAFSAATRKSNKAAASVLSKTLTFELQKCATPSQVLQKVAPHVNPSTDPTGNIASLILIRLSKQCLSLDNSCSSSNSPHYAAKEHYWKSEILASKETSVTLKNIVESLALSSARNNSNESLESVVEGTKALAILTRLLPECIIGQEEETINLLLQQWDQLGSDDCSYLEPHQLSGLQWAYQCFQHTNKDTENSIVLPDNLQKAYDDCNLPFQIIPGYFEQEKNLSVDNLVQEVAFQVDNIRTTSNQVVPERRQTAWQGDDGVSPFEYSGKAMPRLPWSPLVRSVRNGLVERTGQYYDGCLLNWYPDGGSAMRYHVDPDQGSLWDYATAVVSVGATRRVAFRDIPSTSLHKNSKPHNFVVLHGDVMEMLEDCQMRFQHTVKPAENKQEQAARCSLVFKRSLKV